MGSILPVANNCGNVHVRFSTFFILCYGSTRHVLSGQTLALDRAQVLEKSERREVVVVGVDRDVITDNLYTLERNQLVDTHRPDPVMWIPVTVRVTNFLLRLSRVATTGNHHFYSAFTLGRMSRDKLLHVRLKTLLATLFNGSVHTSHMWSDLSSDIR